MKYPTNQNTLRGLNAEVANTWPPSKQHTSGKITDRKNNRRITLRPAIIIGSIMAFIAISGVVLLNGKAKPLVHTPLTAVSSSPTVSNPVDTVSSTDIAETVTHLTNLPESTAVHNEADSADVQSVSPVSSGPVTEKPIVIGTAMKTKADIQKYTTQSGDTISNLAAKFSVTSDSIRWSNDLTGNSVVSGKVLLISPISNGIVYKVQTGDTPDSLAKKFQANRDRITTFNDAEIAGLTIGDLIVIPGGSQPIPTFASATLSSLGGGFAWGGNAPVYGTSGYDFGQCTYYAALRRQQIGSPVPSNLGNAITWVALAQKAGLSTGSVPHKGAIIWTPPSILSAYYAQYGHVGFVEDVLPDGTVKVSDMNVKGWNVVSQRTLTAEQASAYSYIY